MVDSAPDVASGSAREPRQSTGRPPKTPVWVWVFGSFVAVFLLAIVVFFIAGGDHGGGGQGGDHGAGSINSTAMEGAVASDAPVPVGLQATTSGCTVSSINGSGPTGEGTC